MRHRPQDREGSHGLGVDHSARQATNQASNLGRALRGEIEGEMNREDDIAERLLKATLRNEPEGIAIGDVTNFEIAYLASKRLISCPACGAEAWCDIDCHVCQVVSDIQCVVEGENRGKK